MTTLIGELSLDASRAILFKMIAKMVTDSKERPIDFWLMW
jgi:hypothetical protein